MAETWLYCLLCCCRLPVPEVGRVAPHLRADPQQNRYQSTGRPRSVSALLGYDTQANARDEHEYVPNGSGHKVKQYRGHVWDQNRGLTVATRTCIRALAGSINAQPAPESYGYEPAPTAARNRSR